MPPKQRPPSSLASETDITLRCHPLTKRILMTLADRKTSYDLGSYFRKDEYGFVRDVAHDGMVDTELEEGVCRYLTRALGGRGFVAENAVVCAFNWGTALVDIKTGYVMPVESSTHAMREGEVCRKMMEAADLSYDREDGGIAIAERMVPRGAADLPKIAATGRRRKL